MKPERERKCNEKAKEKKEMTNAQKMILMKKIDSRQRERSTLETAKWHMRHKPYAEDQASTLKRG